MRTSDLNRRMTIQTHTTTRDAANAPVDAWTDGPTLWCARSPLYQAKTYEGQNFISKATYQLTFRWSRSLLIQTTNQIKYVDPGTSRTHIYGIEAVFDDEKEPNTWVHALVYALGDPS